MKRLFTKRSGPEESNLDALNGVRVITLALVVLGNTYFYILKGALQNLEIIEEWMSDTLFTIVISAELAVDIFFWLTAFLASYFLLVKMDDNCGNYGSIIKIYFNRFMRLFPLYLFTLLFFWKFIALYGGEGPMFFMYEVNH